MQNISVGRYSNPKSHGWAGWIEPDDWTWIAFVGLDGRPLFFLNRDPETGGILGDDPAEHEALKAFRREDHGPGAGAYTGTRLTDEHIRKDPSIHTPGIGEPVFPLGVSGNGGVDVEPT